MNNEKTQRVLFIQLGCSKNRVDGEIMISALENAGFLMVDNETSAGIIIINTCGFIEDAKKEAISEIVNAISHKDKKVIVTGCLAQRYKDEIMENFPEIYGVAGIFDTDKIVEIVNTVKTGKKMVCYDGREMKTGGGRTITTPFYYAYLKIADGCDNHCSYCAIPSIRGRYKSREFREIISETKMLAENGASEIIVVAQDTTRYGIDLYKEKRLVSLLYEMEKIEEIKWIRLHYLYPEAFTPELIDYVKNSEKALPYFDIPIQHINGRILKLMNRRTNKEQIIALLNEIKEKIPHAVIRTSLISGFPTETGEEHKELLKFVKKGYFDRLGVFPYSPEEGTPAFKIRGRVPKKVREKRAGEIMQSQNAVSLSKNKKRKNQVIETLVEGYDTVNNVYLGRGYMDSPEIDGTVYFKSAQKHEFGDYVKVKITGCDEYDLIGERV